jgi:hypothetical protein
MLRLTLYPNHFTFNESETLEYSEPFIKILDYISRGEIPPFVKDLDPLFINGNLYVSVCDARLNPPIVTQVECRPSAAFVYNDIKSLFKQDFLEAEAAFVTLYHTLNLNPSFDTLFKEQTMHYNRIKMPFVINKKRKFNKQECSMQEVKKLTLMLNDSTFIPKFNLLSFIQDWRKKKDTGDAQVLQVLPDKKKVKKNGVSIVGPQSNCVRTLKFEQEILNSKLNYLIKEKKYTILNIYEIFQNEFEAILRWGSIEGTSVNGSTLRYPLGNKVAVEYYIGHFKGFYGITHRLVLDSIAQPKLSVKSSSISTVNDYDERMSTVSSIATSDQESPVTNERRRSVVKLKVKPLKK